MIDTATIDFIHREPHKVGHWAGFNDLTELHGDWIRSMLFSNDSETLMAHRESYKTTCLAIALALYALLLPNDSVILIRKTDYDVKEIIIQIAKLLCSDVYQELSFRLYGHGIKLTESSSFRISTDLNTSPRGASQILGLGIKTSMQGKHAELVATDDIVNMRDRISRPERELTKTLYRELTNIKTRGGRIFNTCTPWHKDDATSLMPNVRRYDCYETNLISKEKQQALRRDLGDSMFAINYELKHIADADMMFSEPRYTDDNELLYNGICHIDASYGGGDGTAFSAAKEQDGSIVVYGKLWQKHVNDCIPEIMALRNAYRLGSIALEKNADKGYLAAEFRELGCPVSEYHETTNKFVKISSHLRKAWSSIIFHEDTDAEYINQILDYNEFAAHDDAPDSLASLIRRLIGTPQPVIRSKADIGMAATTKQPYWG